MTGDYGANSLSKRTGNILRPAGKFWMAPRGEQAILSADFAITGQRIAYVVGGNVDHCAPNHLHQLNSDVPRAPNWFTNLHRSARRVLSRNGARRGLSLAVMSLSNEPETISCRTMNHATHLNFINTSAVAILAVATHFVSAIRISEKNRTQSSSTSNNNITPA